METLLNLSEDSTIGMYVTHYDDKVALKIHDFDKSLVVYLTKEQSSELRKLLAKAEVECEQVNS